MTLLITGIIRMTLLSIRMTLLVTWMTLLVTWMTLLITRMTLESIGMTLLVTWMTLLVTRMTLHRIRMTLLVTRMTLHRIGMTLHRIGMTLHRIRMILHRIGMTLLITWMTLWIIIATINLMIWMTIHLTRMQLLCWIGRIIRITILWWSILTIITFIGKVICHFYIYYYNRLFIEIILLFLYIINNDYLFNNN
ncbi:hypothetical protein QLL95_gp0893 [Cotonvirus japonicus]|uniref:Uncharacterized protein n=1 Tax=Cotonvirus japonicus TaxID=2811091 RepID=A0ABM7NST2_9VIRU|nr:hypothetical protein QLL95_gp0893 [Cotonvirus japonicus]BCS83230.1 hypothetical protein [Cotonvirus japonicus]